MSELEKGLESLADWGDGDCPHDANSFRYQCTLCQRVREAAIRAAAIEECWRILNDWGENRGSEVAWKVLGEPMRRIRALAEPPATEES